MSFLSRKPRRLKPGTGFLLVRLIGWCLQIVGWLLIVVGLVSFIVTLVKAWPTFIGAFEYIEQKMAGFVIAIIAGGLLVLLLLGVGGAILAGIGFAFVRWGTEPVNAAPVQSPTAATPARRAEPS